MKGKRAKAASKQKPVTNEKAPLAELRGVEKTFESRVNALRDVSFSIRRGEFLSLLGAGLLGWVGAGLVTGHYLRQTRPVER